MSNKSSTTVGVPAIDVQNNFSRVSNLRRISICAVVASLIHFAIFAAENSPSTSPPPPDKETVSYALGMNFGMQRKAGNIKGDMGAFLDAIRDVLNNKTARISQQQAASILNGGRPSPDPRTSSGDPADDDKKAYAMGMRIAGQLKRDGAEIEMDALEQGLRDELDGKPTRIKENDLEATLGAAEIAAKQKKAARNKIDGETFLTKNSKKPGVKVLPSGLQYEVVSKGNGPKPAPTDLVLIKFAAQFADASVFNHNDHFLTRTTSGMPGVAQAMQMMNVGDHYELAIPAKLAYGDEGEPIFGVGPNTALRYDLSILEILKPGDPRIGTGSVGHGLDGERPEVFNR